MKIKTNIIKSLAFLLLGYTVETHCASRQITKGGGETYEGLRAFTITMDDVRGFQDVMSSVFAETSGKEKDDLLNLVAEEEAKFFLRAIGQRLTAAGVARLANIYGASRLATDFKNALRGPLETKYHGNIFEWRDDVMSISDLNHPLVRNEQHGINAQIQRICSPLSF
ncbi:MAG: hypothetical protein LBL99_01410 [Holosporaceae bacterium]|jgi:hypothetical protein|nr:hypothetical protein [Holosporaceae bacterium]